MAILCLLSSVALAYGSPPPAPLAIAADEDVIHDYELYLSGRDPLSISQYGGPHSRRDVIEIVLLLQALRAGGYEGEINLLSDKSYRRILQTTKAGVVLMSAPLVWLADLQSVKGAFWITEPIVKEGEFIAGIYTTPDNDRALSANTPEKLKLLTAVSNSHWAEDVHVLKSLGFKHIYYETYWLQIVRMVIAKRADVTLAPFQATPDMGFAVDQSRLVPIPGVKVTLRGSRVWALSKKYPNNKAIFDALNRGIAILKSEGKIQQAYEESGFFNPKVQDWTLLNPPSKH